MIWKINVLVHSFLTNQLRLVREIQEVVHHYQNVWPPWASPKHCKTNFFVVTSGEFAQSQLSQAPNQRKSQPQSQRSQWPSQPLLGLQPQSQQGIESQDNVKKKEKLIWVAKQNFVTKASSIGYFFIYKGNEDEDEQQEFNMLVCESLNQAVLETGGAYSVFSFKSQQF